MIKKNNAQNTVFILSLVVFGAMVGIYVYMYAATDGLIMRTIEAKKMLAANETARAQGEDMIKLYDSTKEQRDRLAIFFVPSENAVTVIQAIESIGDSSGAGVELSSVKANAPADVKNKIVQVTASVKISGQWRDVMRAMELFETLPYQKSIRNVSLNGIESGEAGKKTYRWESTFDISIATLQRS